MAVGSLVRWFKEAYGKKLTNLHSWNAWLALGLTATGVVLFLPIRGELGAFRVLFKQLHIYLGLLSVLVIALYVPLLRKHWRQLSRRPVQRRNLILVLFLLAGWVASGAALWQFRQLPPWFSNIALFLHDVFTWVGVPYALYHSVTRSRWIKQPTRTRAVDSIDRETGEETGNTAGMASHPAAGVVLPRTSGRPVSDSASAIVAGLKKSPVSRRTFLQLAAGAVVVFGLGPAFFRWLMRATDAGGSQLEEFAQDDLNKMLPAPVPLPESAAVAGGGAKGQFRVYTVTTIPTFSSNDWKFALSGLVEKPAVWDWEQLLKLPRKTQVSDFHCVTGWSVTNVTWEGIQLKDLLQASGVQSGAKFVKFYSGDKVYTDTLTLEQAQMDDVMAAVLMDGKPIPHKLGGPVRLVVPKMYAYKSVKWLQAIELNDKEQIGYWEVRGYDTDAWVKKT